MIPRTFGDGRRAVPDPLIAATPRTASANVGAIRAQYGFAGRILGGRHEHAGWAVAMALDRLVDAHAALRRRSPG